MTQIAIWNSGTGVFQLVEAPGSYPYSLGTSYANEAAFLAGEWPGCAIDAALSTSVTLVLIKGGTRISIARPSSYPHSPSGIFADQAAWLAALYPGWTLITATIPSDIDTVPYEYDGTNFVPVTPVLNRLDSLIALLVSKSVITSGEADALPL